MYQRFLCGDIMSSLVSVIIPVYNIEAYIENCLRSVVSQTYSDIEILCVDDGSVDGSAEIIKQLSEKDERIKYFYQTNSGVSSARNKGLDNSLGDYVFFVDGDDYLHPRAIEISVDCAEKTNADMVCSHYVITQSLNEKPENISSYSYSDTDFETLFKKGDKLGKCTFAKLIKKSVTENIRFPEGIAIGEDGCYIIKLMNENINAVTVDKALYYYLKREGSATTSELNEKRLTILYAYDGMCDYLRDSKNAEIKAYCLRSVFYNINTRRTLYKNSRYEGLVKKECKRIGKKHLRSFLTDKNIPLPIRLLHFTFFKIPFLYTVFQRLY